MPSTAIRVREIAFTGYPVKDMKRARHFYESILHLIPTKISEDEAWVEYDVNGAAFLLGNFEGWEPASRGPAVGFEVDDIEEVIEALRAEKVRIFEEPFETPGCWIAIVGDPDGNTIMIHKRKPNRG